MSALPKADFAPADLAIAAAMIAAGWTDAQIGAAFRAAATVSNETVAAPAPAEAATRHETVSFVPAKPLVKARARLTADGKLPRSAARVGAVIADHFDTKTGLCTIGTEALALKSGLSRATVFRALRALEVRGWLSRLSYGGIGHANAYRLNLTAGNETVAPTVLRDGRTDETRSLNKNITPLTPLGAATVVEKPKRRGRPVDPRQREMPLMRTDPTGNAWEAGVSARQAAAIGNREARESAYFSVLSQQLQGCDERVRNRVVLIYFDDERLRRKAVAAERLRPAAGLALLLDEVRERETTGPPG